jgi:hypothetical protein
MGGLFLPWRMLRGSRFRMNEFVAELGIHGIEPLGMPRRILANDIFIGVAKRGGRRQGAFFHSS